MTRARLSKIVLLGAVGVAVLAVGVWPEMAVAAERFENPLGSDSLRIDQVITKVIKWMLGLVASLAMIALVWGSVRMILSLGNEQQVQKAKQIILWAVAGLVVVLLSMLIITTVQNFLGVKADGGGSQSSGSSGPSGVSGAAGGSSMSDDEADQILYGGRPSGASEFPDGHEYTEGEIDQILYGGRE